jgi:hypothetical protein
MEAVMIAKKIYEGWSFFELGITPAEYTSRKLTVDRFAAQWNKQGDFEPAYAAWISEQPEGRPDGGPPAFTEDDIIRIVFGGDRARMLSYLDTQQKKVYDRAVPSQRPMPAPAARAQNFAKAMFRFVVEGLPVESKAKAAERLAVCEKNECGFFDGSVCRHAKCGCFTKIKTFLTTEHCPIGKW